MSQLGDVLELLHGSGTAWTTIHLEGREWHNDARFRAAFDRFLESRGRPPSGLPAPPTESEDPWVYSEIAGHRKYAHFRSADHVAYVVFAGPTWWSWTDHLGRPGNTNAGSRRDITHGIGPAEVLLKGSMMVPWLDMTVGANINVAGREAVTVQATPRSGEEAGLALHLLGTGADSYELAIDRERGAILRAEARLEGNPFRVVEVTSVIFDEPIEAQVFEPPANIEFREMPEFKPPGA
jgi:hypothetical protein